MRNKMLPQAERYIKKRSRFKLWHKIVGILGCVVVFCTTYALILPAITQEKVTYCGMEEHVHGPECYERRLICSCCENVKTPDNSEELGLTNVNIDNDEEGLTQLYDQARVHVHTDECYEEVLICKKPEHKHTLACFSNPKADIESREVWERTVAGVKLTKVWADDIVAIAESQLGYEESSANYAVMEDGKTMKGYTRYGAWYGSPYADWCAMFVSFCLDYAKIPITSVPRNASCNLWVDTLSNANWNLYQKADEYTPLKGDIVFFDFNGNESSDHVGIVAEVKDEKIKTIEGNSANKVRYETYTLDDKRILGYAVLPEYEEYESTKLAELTKTAVIYTDESYETLSDDTTTITLVGIIPEEAEVRAYPTTVESNEREVICSYDISIFMPDGSLYEPAEGEKINVSIQTAEMDEGASNVEAFYFPDEGEPVPMDTFIDEAGVVSFDTDHFSNYALLGSGTMEAVYLNGATGNDNNSGASGSPVKTFAKALSLVSQTGTIYISGTVTISNTQTWSGVKVQRASGFNGPLATVANGGSLTVSEGLTMNGGCGTLSPAYTYPDYIVTTYADNSAKAPLIVVNAGGSLNIADGAVLERNSNKPDTDSDSNYVPNGYVGLGGAVYSQGTLTMTGGTIRQCESLAGGGVHIAGGIFTLSGGTIDGNVARYTNPIINDYYNPSNNFEVDFVNTGGGVHVGDNSTMLMSGGTVSNNQCTNAGGGIALRWRCANRGYAVYSYTTYFNMTGGTINRNKAARFAGGLAVEAGSEATISAGYITNNTVKFTTSHSGGGIYVDERQLNNSGQHAGVPGKLLIHRVVITNNTAGRWGGAISACPEGNSYVNGHTTLNNGTAIYSNHSNDQYWSGYPEVLFTNGQFEMTDTVLGGGQYNWERTTVAGTGGSVGMTFDFYRNSLTDSSPAIVTAKNLATTWITGNNASGHGGGIANNGILDVGGYHENTTISISITKNWQEDEPSNRPAYIDVQILRNGQAYRDPIRIYKSINKYNQEVWPTYYVDDLPIGYTYSIQEVSVPGYTSTITKSGSAFTITNKGTLEFKVVKKWVGDTAANRPATVNVQLYRNGLSHGNPVQLTSQNWSYTWQNLPKFDANNNPYTYTADEVSIPAGYYKSSNQYVDASGAWEITNTRIETTSVSVKKQWGAETQPTSSVTVQLRADGQAYGPPVVLNSANNWFYKWDDLPKYTAQTAPNGIPIQYKIDEINPTGYTVTTVKLPNNWSPVNALENGKTYMLVASPGALERSYNGEKFGWINLVNEFSLGTDWTFNSTGSKLINANYPNLSYMTIGQKSGKLVFFVDPTQSSPMNFSNGRLSTTLNGTTYYFVANTAPYSKFYGTTTTNPAKATIFTLCTKIVGSGTHYVITNTKAPVTSLEIHFGKYSKSNDGSTPILIAGANLSLYRQDASGVTIPGTSVKGTLVNQWTSAGAGQIGSIHIENLEEGTYYLIETTQPEGHVGISGPIVFTVAPATGEVIVQQYPGNSSMEGTNLFNGEKAELPVYNTPAYSLPETGGSGIILFTVGGILLMASALILLLYIRKNYRKEAR